MTYVQHDTFNLNHAQRLKISKVADGRMETALIRLHHVDLNSGSDKMLIRETDYRRLHKAINSGKGFQVEVNKAMIDKNLKGGFLGVLLSLLQPAIESTIGHIGKAISGNGKADRAELRGYGIGQKAKTVLTKNDQRALRQAVDEMLGMGGMAGSGIGDDIKKFFQGFIKGFTDPIGSIKGLIDGTLGKGLLPEDQPKPIRAAKHASKKLLEGSGLTFY